MIRVSEDCEQDNPCNGNKCPKHSDCIPSWQNHTCKCHTGNYCENLLFNVQLRLVRGVFEMATPHKKNVATQNKKNYCIII